MPDESSSSITPDVLTRARRIKLFLMDVDGTLTDGGVCLISPLAIEHYEAQLVTEMKVFNAQDGQGPSLLKQVCHYTTKRGGGRGAAREVIELILKAQGRWDEAVPLALA